MRKGLIVLLVAVVAVVFALPAMADMTPTNLNVSGFYRAKAYLSNFVDGYSAPSIRRGTPGDLEQTNAFVDQRFRVRFEFGTENVKAVWHLESDAIWGDASGGNKQFTTDTTGLGAARNSGGALGGDRISTETKNIYVWFKVPDTSLDFSVGLQNQSDAYAGIMYGGVDFAGIFLTGKVEPVSYKLGMGKLYENQPKNSDDMTLYVAEVNLVPTKDMKLGLNFYFLQDDTQKAATIAYSGTVSGIALPGNNNANPYGALNSKKIYTPGVNVAFKAGPATLSGFAVYQFGKIDYSQDNATVKDVDIQAYMLDARADLNVGPGKAFLEGFYMSGGDNPKDKYKSIITLATNDGSPGGNSSYTRTNMSIILNDGSAANVSQCLIGCSGGELGSDPGFGGRGIWHVAGGFAMPFTKQLKGEVNAGYVSATKKLATDTVQGTSIGTELNANVSYNVAKGLDITLAGGYAWLGDWFKVAGSPDVKDAYITSARVNYAY